jgi:hypothetical protein
MRGQFALNHNSELSVGKELGSSLIKLDENCNSGTLSSKPRCHVVPTAFPISKQTAAVDILLIVIQVQFRVVCKPPHTMKRSASFQGYEKCDNHKG